MSVYTSSVEVKLNMSKKAV